MIIDFVCWIAVVSLAAAFLLGVAVKWRWLEWLQVHAPNDFLHELFMCRFCMSFHISFVICVFLAIFVSWWCILIPPFSCVIASKL